MEDITLRGHKGIGEKVEGEALVSHEPISFYADVDPKTGIITNKLHELYGANVKNKILFFPTGKGGIGSLWQLVEMKENGVAPKAMINIKSHPVFVQGAIIANISIIDRFEKNPIELVNTGDKVIVDPKRGIINIIK